MKRTGMNDIRDILRQAVAPGIEVRRCAPGWLPCGHSPATFREIGRLRWVTFTGSLIGEIRHSVTKSGTMVALALKMDMAEPPAGGMTVAGPRPSFNSEELAWGRLGVAEQVATVATCSAGRVAAGGLGRALAEQVATVSTCSGGSGGRRRSGESICGASGHNGHLLGEGAGRGARPRRRTIRRGRDRGAAGGSPSTGGRARCSRGIRSRRGVHPSRDRARRPRRSWSRPTSGQVVATRLVGTTGRLGRSVPASRCRPASSASVCTVLPRPMSSASTPPKPHSESAPSQPWPVSWQGAAHPAAHRRGP